MQNPIWGWLVINYAEAALQIYLADGTFYREVRKGGHAGTETGLKWLPFDPPHITADSNSSQLDHLILKLDDPNYLQGFFDMINSSVEANQSHAPNTYATYSSAIIGKPLALANAGWSLELSQPQTANWSSITTADDAAGNLSLLRPDGISSFEVGDPGAYSFRVKLGDRDRTWDGLVGYYPAASPAPQTGSPLDLSSIYTYYGNTDTAPGIPSPFRDLNADGVASPAPHPSFTCFYLDPATSDTRDAYWHVFGLILDPFLAVHAYSAILPNVALKLPAWTVEQGLKRITAFWRTGPHIVREDLPATYEPSRAVSADDVGTGLDPLADMLLHALPKVQIPLRAPAGAAGGGGASYRYLQPYADVGVDGTVTTRYNAFGISDDSATGADAKQLRLDPGPYTALEGYMQIVKSGASAEA